ncbi:MAG: RNA polymerase sigma factor [Gemmatimonadetes bacterium]|nr:RNA polymerase sigma factor [Gemmatimonadota bacterium]
MGAPAPAVGSDGDLIARYLGGDESAAAELVRRHAPPLARFLLVQGVPDDELDDVVQDALFKAFRALRSYRGDAAFRTWLLAIGGNVLRDRRRHWRRRQVTELTPDIADPGSDPAGEAEASVTAAKLREGIGRLARLQREVFLLRAQSGLSYQEISRGLGISEGAARVHYHHAVKRLKAWII